MDGENNIIQLILFLDYLNQLYQLLKDHSMTQQQTATEIKSKVVKHIVYTTDFVGENALHRVDLIMVETCVLFSELTNISILFCH